MDFRRCRVPLAFLFTVFFWTSCSNSGTPNEPPVNPNNANNTAPAAPAAPTPKLLTPGDYNLTLNSGGADRSYILHVPPSFDGSQAMPLVFVLHGLGGNAESMVHSTKMNLLADQKNFFVAYLNGQGDPQGWNTGITSWLTTPLDDVAYIRALAADLETQLKVDTKRIYVMGFSNGAFMTHVLGAEASDLFAAGALAEGTIGMNQADGSVLKTPTPSAPFPILIMHGQDDARIPYNGGQSDKPQVNVLSVADAVKMWTDADGCTGGALTMISPNGNFTVNDYKTCTGDTEVKLITLTNGQHQWPTPADAANFSGTEAAWNFFSQHAKN